MKKLLLSLMIVAAGMLTSNMYAQVESGAKIEFKKETHEYGNIAYASNGACTFNFKNTGDAPLIITDAKKSCGCTVPTWPRDPIAPGASAKITVKYDTKRPGVFAKKRYNLFKCCKRSKENYPNQRYGWSSTCES